MPHASSNIATTIATDYHSPDAEKSVAAYYAHAITISGGNFGIITGISDAISIDCRPL
jgi:hypothetical protein